MKKYFISLMVIGFLSSEVLVIAAPQTPADHIVKSLYENFSPDKSSIIDQPLEVLSQYFDPRLTMALIEEQACKQKTGEVCHLDFDPLFDAQDMKITNLKIGKLVDMDNRINVSFENNGQTTLIIYRMRKTPAGWRIGDLVYKGGRTLERILKSPAN